MHKNAFACVSEIAIELIWNAYHLNTVYFFDSRPKYNTVFQICNFVCFENDEIKCMLSLVYIHITYV